MVGILAQRLVRLICPSCKTPYVPSDQELKELGLHRDALVDAVVHKGEGCAHCFGSGFKGRHGIYELMVISNAIKRQLLQSADAVALQKCALESGMQSLRYQGAQLVLEGKTSTSEVLRVTRELEAP